MSGGVTVGLGGIITGETIIGTMKAGIHDWHGEAMPVGMQVVGNAGGGHEEDRVAAHGYSTMWTGCVSEVCVCGCGMWDASVPVWCTIDLTRDEHALYTSRPVIGCGPFKGICEQEEMDSTVHVQCATTTNQ
jgi:hypothetical protein